MTTSPSRTARKLGATDGHELPVVVAEAAKGLGLLGRDAVTAIVVEPLLRVVAAHPLPGQVGHEPLGLRAPELDAEALGEPVRVADVIRMEVGDEHAHEGPPGQLAGEELLPQLARRRQPDPGVHHRHPGLVVEQPQVDVVELEGQRHPDPADAGRHQDARAALGGLGPGMRETGGGRGQRMLGLGFHGLYCTPSGRSADLVDPESRGGTLGHRGGTRP